jgi:uncharacterized protein (DUF2235 family)
MARRYEWPDPKDRSPNNPHTLLEREAVIDLYRQGTGNEDAKNLTEAIKEWFVGEAKERGWDDVTWADQTAVLKKVWK